MDSWLARAACCLLVEDVVKADEEVNLLAVGLLVVDAAAVDELGNEFRLAEMVGLDAYFTFTDWLKVTFCLDASFSDTPLFI